MLWLAKDSWAVAWRNDIGCPYAHLGRTPERDLLNRSRSYESGCLWSCGSSL